MKARKLRRLHLYGDIYSSPGISLRQKQLLMCAFLGEANMPEQLFGHLLAVSDAAAPSLCLLWTCRPSAACCRLCPAEAPLLKLGCSRKL